MNRALLIVDVQNEYFPGGKCELYHATQALFATKQLLKYFRERRLPVFFIQHIANKEATFFVPNTNAVTIHPDICPLSKEIVIRKHFPNSFYQTSLQKELQKLSINELVVCGMMSHMCIDTTVRAAKDLGYHITLIADACTTKDLEWQGTTILAKVVQEVYMASLNEKFANIMNVKDYLENYK